MDKFLDKNGVKYLWAKIIDKINNIGDTIIKNPQIRIIGGGVLDKQYGCYPKYYVENGQKYIDQGYIPMLFTRRAVRQLYKPGAKLNGEVLVKKTYTNTTAEWRRYSDIFVEITPPDMGVGPDQLAFYRCSDTPIANEKDHHFGALFCKAGVYHNLYNNIWTANLGALLVPEREYGNGWIAPRNYVYNGKGILSTFPDYISVDFGDGVDLSNPTNSVLLRPLHFDFKFCFVKNKWVWKNNSYDPKIPIAQNNRIEYYSKSRYPDYHLYSRAKYTLDDAVSNIVDIKVHVYPGVSTPGYHTKYKIDILN